MQTFYISAPPPSVNGMYPGKERRFKSPAAKAWERLAIAEIKSQKPERLEGWVSLEIVVQKGRGDVSNRLKAAEDAIVKAKVIPDDKWVWSVTATWSHAVKGCEITISPYEEKKP